MGAAARFNHPTGVVVDPAGNVYVADNWNHTIRKITPDGVVTTFAGAAGAWGSTDGTGAAARFNYPNSLVVDMAGNVYVADTSNSAIRKITATGATTTVAGTAGRAGIILGTSPGLAFPTTLALVGDSIIVGDSSAILLLRHDAR
jgi:DNA-binding beta-propeller fold protein YncE